MEEEKLDELLSSNNFVFLTPGMTLDHLIDTNMEEIVLGLEFMNIFNIYLTFRARNSHLQWAIDFNFVWNFPFSSSLLLLGRYP